MSNENQNDMTPDVQLPDEKALLLQRAKMMGLRVSNNASVDTLKAKIAEATASEEEAHQAEAKQEVTKKAPKKKSLRQYMVEKHMKLVRLRITNLDPKKKDLPGEIITVANKYLGTVRKYVPFGEQTEDGYHVPYCIYQFLKARRFLHIRTIKDKNVIGGERVVSAYVPEFALEILPPLTKEELAKLAAAQKAAGNS